LLQTDNPRTRLEELMQIRDPLYREVADIVLQTGQSSVRHAVDRIIRALKNNPA
jgi:shikimate kinase